MKKRIYLEYAALLVLIVPIVLIFVYNKGTWQGSVMASAWITFAWLATRSIQHKIDKEV